MKLEMAISSMVGEEENRRQQAVRHRLHREAVTNSWGKFKQGLAVGAKKAVRLLFWVAAIALVIGYRSEIENFVSPKVSALLARVNHIGAASGLRQHTVDHANDVAETMR